MWMICLWFGFMVLDSLQEFFIHIIRLRPTIEFTLEVETVQFCFWTCWSSCKDLHWMLKSTENPHTGHYLHFQLNHPRVKREVVQSLYHRAATLCQEQTDCCDEIDILSYDLQLSAYLIGIIESFISGAKRNVHLKKVQPIGCLSERLKCTANRYSIRTDFKTRHTLTNSLMRTRPMMTPQETANCVYFISCK